MKIFEMGPRSPQLVLVRTLAAELRFLEGRTEKYEGISIQVEARPESVSLKFGDRERHTLTYHSRDNTWTLSFYPRDPWMEKAITSFDIATLARQAFVGSVLYSLRACKQIGGAPMITSAEEAQLSKGSSARLPMGYP